MSHPFNYAAPEGGHPFVVETRMVLHDRNRQDLRSDAKLIITPAFRTSGLLNQLTDREAKLLLALLAYNTPNGRYGVSSEQLAKDLGLSPKDLRRQLDPMTHKQWNGQPLVRHIQSRERGEHYTLSLALIGSEQLKTVIDLHPEQKKHTPLASKDAVIQASRQKYTRPQEEVESMVLAQLGFHPEESSSTPEGAIRRGLRDAGLSRDQIEFLLTEYGYDACKRQLDWLPLRAAKNPSRFLVAAIEGNYDPPRGAKLHQLLEQPPQEQEGLDGQEELPELEFSVLDDLPIGDDMESDDPDHERPVAFQERPVAFDL